MTAEESFFLKCTYNFKKTLDSTSPGAARPPHQIAQGILFTRQGYEREQQRGVGCADQYTIASLSIRVVVTAMSQKRIIHTNKILKANKVPSVINVVAKCPHHDASS